MLRAWDVAERAVKKRLKRVTAEVGPMQKAGVPVPEQTQRTQARYEALVSQIRQAMERLVGPAEEAIASGQQDAVEAAQNGAQSVWKAAIGPTPANVTREAAQGVYGAFNRLPTATVEALVGYAGDGSPLHVLLRDATNGLPDLLRSELIAGVAMGENPRTIARRMAVATGQTRARMENIARTETLRAAREATRRTYEANPTTVTGWRWTSAKDGRTCPSCWAMDGRVFPTSERFGSHPQCRCVMVPVTPSWADLLGDAELDDTREEPPAGPEVFAGQSKAVQRQVLGPAAYGRYAAGDLALEDFVHESFSPRWGLTRTAASLAQAEANAAEQRNL